MAVLTLAASGGLTSAEVLVPPQTVGWEPLAMSRQAARDGRSPTLSAWLGFAGDTNVLPILEADDDPLPPRLHRRGTSRFLSQSLSTRRLDFGQWRLTRGWASVSYLNGNGDAGQLWLDLESNAERTGVRYTPSLAGHETKLAWWGVSCGFAASVPELGGVPLRGRVGLRLLESFRHREAGISGWYENNQFQGKLRLLSTRGAGFSTIGHGYSLDVDLAADVSPRCTVGLRADGLLARLRWGQVRLLEADVNSANVFQDPQGFLHNLPAATGTERRFAYSSSLTTLWRFGATWQQGDGYWAGVVSHGGTPTTYQVSRVQQLGRGQFLKATWLANRNTLGLTYWNRYVTVSVSSSHASLSNAFVGSVGVGVTLP